MRLAGGMWLRWAEVIWARITPACVLSPVPPAGHACGPGGRSRQEQGSGPRPSHVLEMLAAPAGETADAVPSRAARLSSQR